MPMDVFHILLGRPWQFDMKVIYASRENTFNFEKHGRIHTIRHFKEENLEEEKVFLVGGKEFMH